MSNNKLPPEFVNQPLCFNQVRFREDFFNKPHITLFKEALAGVNSHLRQRFKEHGDVRSLVTERSGFIDLLLHYAWHQYPWGDNISLMAVGGYGRGELHPHSDIDILILISDDISSDVKKSYENNLQTFITFLWDIGLDLGSSVRTLSECINITKENITVMTNLVESRRLCGSNELCKTLYHKTQPDEIWEVADFFKAKKEEQQERHEKHNDTEYNLEPHVKNAPGGLRDIQTINWVAKRFFDVRTLQQLEGWGFFTEHEFGLLRRGEELLWKIRYGLHDIAGRAEERLLFEYQRELAQLFGFEDDENSLAVESFMHEYYRTAMALRELNDVLMQYLEESIYRHSQKNIPCIINERFQLRENYIEMVHERIFDENPSALLEIFVLMGNSPKITGPTAKTIRLLREKRYLIDSKFRKKTENKAMFMSLFSIKTGLVTQLTRMKRYGILGRYLPAFGKITGQMQHDLFHRYTVDAHTLLVVRNIRRFTQPEEEKLFPIAAHIIKHLPKPELLCVAALFHDIGKGRGGDHSTLGAVDAREFCEEHGLNGQETRLICWLVEKHLLMSYISQKKDISDPEVIHQFATEVRDQRRLDYLYALTVADMCGTNPEIWNTWRASLMRQLYMETKRALRRGLEITVDAQDLIDETKAQSMLKLLDKNISEKEILSIWSDMGDEYFIRENHFDIAWQTEALITHRKKLVDLQSKNDEALILIRETISKMFAGATQIFVRVKDSQHVFAAVSNCLARLNLNIQDAKIYNSADGYALDTFYVLDENFQALGSDQKRQNNIVDALHEELRLTGKYSEITQRRTTRQLKSFSIPTQTMLSNDIVGNYTVLEVISPDRPGLLATIAQIFLDYGIHLRNAKISTLGERVEDVFFMTDSNDEPLSDPKICQNLQDEICKKLDQQVEKELTH